LSIAFLGLVAGQFITAFLPIEFVATSVFNLVGLTTIAGVFDILKLPHTIAGIIRIA